MLEETFKKMVGATINNIFFSECYLKFRTDSGDFVFSVEGDCCSESCFYDFIGVKNVLGNKIVSIEEIQLEANDIIKDKYGDLKDKKGGNEDIKVYGYRITCEHPEYGEVSGVFSFRNYSNGYYGGWMNAEANSSNPPEIFDDVLET